MEVPEADERGGGCGGCVADVEEQWWVNAVGGEVSQGTADIAVVVEPNVPHTTAVWSGPVECGCRLRLTTIHTASTTTINPATADDDTKATVVVSKSE